MIAIGTTASSMRQTYYDAESCRVKGSLGTLDRSSGCSAARVVRTLGAGAGTTKTANGLTLSVVVAAMAIFAGVVGLGSSRMYVADRHARPPWKASARSASVRTAASRPQRPSAFAPYTHSLLARSGSVALTLASPS